MTISFNKCPCGTLTVEKVSTCPKCKRKVSAVEPNADCENVLDRSGKSSGASHKSHSKSTATQLWGIGPEESKDSLLLILCITLVVTVGIAIVGSLVFLLLTHTSQASAIRPQSQAQFSDSNSDVPEPKEAASADSKVSSPPQTPLSMAPNPLEKIERDAKALVESSKNELFVKAYPSAGLQDAFFKSASSNSDGSYTITFDFHYNSAEDFGGAANHFELRLIYDSSGSFQRTKYGAHTGMLPPGKSTELMGQFIKDVFGN